MTINPKGSGGGQAALGQILALSGVTTAVVALTDNRKSPVKSELKSAAVQVRQPVSVADSKEKNGKS